MLKSLLFFLSPYFNFKFQCFVKAKSLKLKSSLSVLRQILATESAESADYIILHYIILYIIWITPLKVSKLSKHLSSLEKNIFHLSQKNSNYKSNNYFSIVNFDVKQFCVQLQKLFRNKSLRHGKNLRTSLC